MTRYGDRPGDVIHVECYSGHKAEERPVSFGRGKEKRTVVRVIDQWAGEDHDYFKLLADDQRVYIVRYDRSEGFWTLENVRECLGIQKGT